MDFFIKENYKNYILSNQNLILIQIKNSINLVNTGDKLASGYIGSK